ncbi:MAG: TolC family protein [Candidatus Solibacter sp.]
MANRAILWLVFCTSAHAAILPMTLRDVVRRAVEQNPDVTLARLDEEGARHAVQIAKDPFAPRIVVGSGLAYSNGFPMSIEGSAPSIVQAHANQYLFNRQQSYVVAQSKEQLRGAAIDIAYRRDQVVYRTASLYLDAERAARIAALARKDSDSLNTVLASIQAQVKEGRALPLAEKQAALQLARSRQLVDTFENEQATAETTLALVAGLSADDRIRPVVEQRPAAALPTSEEQALQSAMDSNKELRKLQSQIAAKGLEKRGEQAARLPRIDLVAQYGLFAKFNHYEDYFRTFQRHNGQIGVSVQLPVFSGPGVKAQMSQTETEIAHLRVQLNSARNQLSADLQQAFRDVKKAEMSAEVARLDLDVAREQLSVNLAQMQEGRLTLRQVEEARVAENAKWIAFYDTQYLIEKARWSVLRLTGDLVPAIEALP